MPNTRILEVVSAIHKKVREQEATFETPEALEDWSNDLAKLHSAYNKLYSARNLVGTVPQFPSTPLGFVAARIVPILQRLLLWYTLQIRYFHEAVTSALNRICSIEDLKFRIFLSTADRVERLEKEVRRLKADLSAAKPADGLPAAPHTAPAAEAAASPVFARDLIDAKDFCFELQQRFQSNLKQDVTRLETYQAAIASLAPSVPDGIWLDIGCGRGQWLRLAHEAGRDATGVDSSPAAIRTCRENGLRVIPSDALDYLRSAEDGSFAVISAFHILEHCPFEYYLNLVYQVVRTLKPGGVFLIETPHPGNLLMAAEQFWLDPTHQRPITVKLMEFLFEYCGLRVVHRFELSPRPLEEHLPFRELELASRLNQLLYGPQDYALIGRRDE